MSGLLYATGGAHGFELQKTGHLMEQSEFLCGALVVLPYIECPVVCMLRVVLMGLSYKPLP